MSDTPMSDATKNRSVHSGMNRKAANPALRAGLAGLTRHTRSSLTLGLASISLLLCGCLGELNRSDTLLDAPPSALADLCPGASAPAGAPSEASAAASAPLTGLDRRNWPAVVVVAPRQQVQSEPYYFEPALLASGTARDSGAYPTAATVLQSSSDGGSMAVEAAVAPAWTCVELVAWPVRMLFQPPWSLTRQPSPDSPVLPEAQARGGADWRWVGAAPAGASSTP